MPYLHAGFLLVILHFESSIFLALGIGGFRAGSPDNARRAAPQNS